MMLDALAAFVSLTIPTPGERKGGDRRRALLRSSPLPQRGRGAGGEGRPPHLPPSPLPLSPWGRGRGEMMLDALAAFVSLTTPAPGARKGGDDA